MVDLQEKKGKLIIVLTDKDELIDVREKFSDDRGQLSEILDRGRYIGNDWHSVELSLTEAPVIGYGAIYKDANDEAPDDYEKVWVFTDYMIEDFTETLLNKGKVVFKKFK